MKQLLPSHAVFFGRVLRCSLALGIAASSARAQATCSSVQASAFRPNGSTVPVGFKIAMNQTGDRVAIGSIAESSNGVVSGGVWMFSHFGTSSQSDVLIVPSYAAQGLLFSYSLALDATGDVMVVGAPRMSSSWPGRAFVFRFDGTTWIEELQLVGLSGDLFGVSAVVSAAGDVFAIGAPGGDVNPAWDDNAGAVEVYRYQSGSWSREELLRPLDWNGNDNVGNDVAISADGRVIATRSKNNNGSGAGLAVYIFERIGSAWVQVAKLLSPPNQQGGSSDSTLALDATGQILAVGNSSDSRLLPSQGAVLLYRKGGTGWAYDTVLLPSSPNISGGFGKPLSINPAGDRLLVGVRGQALPTANGVGAVEEFEFTGGGWQSVALHFAPNPEPAAGFGTSISGVASRRRWIVSEPWSDAYGLDFGRIHVFDAPCLAPRVYCAALPNSIGCVPQLVTQGVSSCSAPAGFTLSLLRARSQQNGLLFYGTHGRAALPWNGGTLCVQPPLRRTALISSGGSVPPAIDCSGVFSVDFNTWTFTANDPALFPGQHVRAQFYARDPSANSLIYLSEAIEFYLEP